MQTDVLNGREKIVFFFLKKTQNETNQKFKKKIMNKKCKSQTISTDKTA